MADALAYAVRRLKPDLLVDVATLTGAMKISLGLRTGGVFAERRRRWPTACVAAGERGGRALVADAAGWTSPAPTSSPTPCAARSRTCGSARPGPVASRRRCSCGSSPAALPWAHLDIAGPARAEKAYDEVTAGATGFAARTLVELVARVR